MIADLPTGDRVVLLDAAGRVVTPEGITWTPPARPFFGRVAERPRTDSNAQQQRSVLDWYLEVG